MRRQHGKLDIASHSGRRPPKPTSALKRSGLYAQRGSSRAPGEVSHGARALGNTANAPLVGSIARVARSWDTSPGATLKPGATLERLARLERKRVAEIDRAGVVTEHEPVDAVVGPHLVVVAHDLGACEHAHERTGKDVAGPMLARVHP